VATAQHSRPLSFGRSRALPLDRIVAHRAKVIDENGVNGGTRAEGNAPCAERRDARGTLRDHAPPRPYGRRDGSPEADGPTPVLAESLVHRTLCGRSLEYLVYHRWVAADPWRPRSTASRWV
jgi:hypothetical protein